MNAAGDVVDGRFELIERLGSGGMGTVWRARDTVLDRDVALKAVHPEAEASHAVRERVIREAKALARLSNPHVVTVHQIIDTHPHPWIVMELVPGQSLQQRLAEGPLSPEETARIGRQVLTALHVAHTAGIQHRDVKPANVLLRPDGRAVLTDFGIAALQGTTALTATGELVGSPEYMAPERIRGHDDDPASDLWSLGLLLYVCTEGVSPLRRATTLATLAAVLDDPVPPPVRSGPLAQALQSLLVRDPAARPDAARLDQLLTQAESGDAPQWDRPTLTAVSTPAPPVPAPPTLPDSRLPGDPHRHRRAALAVTLTLAAVAVTALVLTLVPFGDDEPSHQAGGSTPSTSTTPATTPRSPSPQQSSPSRRSPSPQQSSSPVQAPSEPVASTPGRSEPSPLPAGTGRWIAQLSSEPVSAGTAARDRHLAQIRATVPEALVLRSDDYAPLRPGYWVIYAPGPFADSDAARAFCAERGRTTTNSCISRYISGRT
ncbi:serine/threonine-protein kinase [Streptomyces sp. NPDC058751]|uniref:serine/threonine-protein kinase n=1 Tax=Streptomyces sp. NPDC058751 TaxID=3346623 RepID=UPI003682939E